MKNVSHRQKFLEGKDIIKTVKTEDDHQAAASSAAAAPSTRPSNASDQNDENMEDADVLGTPPLFGFQSPPSAIQQQEAQQPQSSYSSGSAAAAPGHTEPPPRLSHLPSACACLSTFTACNVTTVQLTAVFHWRRVTGVTVVYKFNTTISFFYV